LTKFTFRNISTLFLLLLSTFTLSRIVACPFAGCWFSAICTNPWLFYGPLLLVYLGISVSMAFFPSSGFHYDKVYSHGSSEIRQLALTFDDGPDAVCTPKILDILKRCNVKAAFFIIGNNIKGNEGILNQAVSDGHIIGNHSWSHTKFWDFYPAPVLSKDIHRCTEETERVTGLRMRLFRPPYGVINPMVAKAIRKSGVEVVAWSFRSYDTVSSRPESILQKTIEKTRNGDVLLFHDSSELTAGILEKIIVSLQERGFAFIPLDEMLKLNAYENS